MVSCIRYRIAVGPVAGRKTLRLHTPGAALDGPVREPLKALTAARDGVSLSGILYDTVNRSIPPAAAWDTSQFGDAVNRETMHLLAPIFGLTDPGAAAPFTQPTATDKTRIAAIHDRHDQMCSAVNWQTLTVTKGAAGSDAWSGHGAALPRLGQAVTVGPGFFAMTDVQRSRHLVLLMATAMHGISAGFRSKYVDAMDAIRTQRALGPLAGC